MGSIITDGTPRRYGARGSGKRGTSRKSFDRGGNYTSPTGSGSSSRRTSYPDFLSKRWENRVMRDPVMGHNIDAIRKGYALGKLGVNTQARMDRLKLALTHPYGSTRINWEDRPSYDDKMGQEWEKRHIERIKKSRYVDRKLKEN